MYNLNQQQIDQTIIKLNHLHELEVALDRAIALLRDRPMCLSKEWDIEVRKYLSGVKQWEK